MITNLLNEVNEKIETLNNLVQDKEYFEKLDERIEKVNNYVQEQKQEIEKLNNIIDEFMEDLKWQRKVSLSLNEDFAVSRIDILINKLQKLKGSDK